MPGRSNVALDGGLREPASPAKLTAARIPDGSSGVERERVARKGRGKLTFQHALGSIRLLIGRCDRQASVALPVGLAQSLPQLGDAVLGCTEASI